MQGLAGYRTEHLNLEGKLIVPGFIDSHVHLLFGGLQVLLLTQRLLIIIPTNQMCCLSSFFSFLFFLGLTQNVIYIFLDLAGTFVVKT